MSSQRTVLVTGAGGFIGGRIVEVMHQLGADRVRAGMRRWTTGLASDVCRWACAGRYPRRRPAPASAGRCDARRALCGGRSVGHGRWDEEAAHRGTCVRRGENVVHISTVDVYGRPEGEVNESRPLTTTGRAYGDSKIEAERACQELAAKGLPVTILRPTLVHGPFSATWTVAYAQRLKRPWLIAEADAQGTCNLLYVDDLASAVLAAPSADTAPGSSNVNGPERHLARILHAAERRARARRGDHAVGCPDSRRRGAAAKEEREVPDQPLPAADHGPRAAIGTGSERDGARRKPRQDDAEPRGVRLLQAPVVVLDLGRRRCSATDLASRWRRHCR